jgi:hypothetical protein
MDKFETLSFSLERAERPVTIAGEDYVLVELDGHGRDKYLTNVAGRVRVNEKGDTTGLKNFDGMEAGLVALCLKKIEDGTRKPVTLATIQSWPGRVITALFDAARDISGLEKGEAKETPDGTKDEEDTEAKND